MTTSIPTKSPDLSLASGAGSAASFFGGDAACTEGASTDFAALLAGNTTDGGNAATAANAEVTTASVLASGVMAPALTVAETETEPVAQTPSREAIEQAAALIASLWNVLQPETPTQISLPTDVGAETAPVASGDVKITLQWGEQTPVVLTLPAGAQPPADLAEQVGEQLSALLGEDALAADLTAETTPETGFQVPDAQPELTISLQVGAATAAVQPDASAAKTGPKVALNGAEKFAGKFRRPQHADEHAVSATEKNFLNAVDEDVTESEESAGIGVAKSEATMPAFFATRHIAPERFESAAHSWISDTAPLQPAAETAATPESAAAASLARKAVDTIQNVIETQHIRTDHMGVVSLNFKFGAEDLAVRVQLRNGEVHTQFRTDSADIRSALSDEWHALVVGQGGDSAHRLIEPVFSPSNSSLAQQHSGSNANQQFAQKQQQEAQAPFAMPEVRTFRKGLSAATAAAAEIAPQIARNLPTSLHLTAFA